MKKPPQGTPRLSGYTYSLYALAAVGAVVMMSISLYICIHSKKTHTNNVGEHMISSAYIKFT